MSIWNQYPYTDFHELNLDWILKKIKEVTKEMNDFKVVNRIVWGGLRDPGKEYPRFCIVDTPTHEGYISIQPVPAGITIDNEDYWRQVANYSALYADFQNRIIALETDVTALDDRVDRLTYKIGVIIGDSYTTHDPITPGTPTWPKNMGELLVEDGFLDEQHSFGADGTRYTATSSNNFLMQLESAVADPSFNNDEVSIVLIEGGQNERFETGYDTATFYNTLKARVITTVSYAKTNFPNAKIVVVPMAWNGKQLKVGPYLNIFNAIYEGASEAGAIIDRSSLYYGRDVNYTWESDGGHPTYDTLKLMVQKIGTIFDGGHVGCDPNYIVLPSTGLSQCKVISQKIEGNVISFTVTGYNSTAIAAGTDLAYVYPGFSDASVYGTGTITSLGDDTADFYQTVDATYTGTVKCLKQIGAGERFVAHFEYLA